MAASDLLIILAMAGGAYVFWLIGRPHASWEAYVLVALAGALVCVNLLQVCGAYRFEALTRPGESLRNMTLTWLAVAVAMLAVSFFTKSSEDYSRAWTGIWLAGSWLGMAAARGLLFHSSRRWLAEGRLDRKVAIIGLGPLTQSLLRRFSSRLNAGVQVVGIYSDVYDPAAEARASHRIAGDMRGLIQLARRQSLDAVIIALPTSEETRIRNLVEQLKTLPVEVQLFPGLIDLPGKALTRYGKVPLLNLVGRPMSDAQSLVKAVEDFVVGWAILIMILPVLLAISVAIKLDTPGPVLFRQKRYGFNNQLIEVFKFRTMYHEMRDENAERLTERNDPRITPLGAFLRKTSLDELPQFLNVVRGEMSVVGPRPHALSAKAAGRLYEEAVRDYAARHRVKPGITGWAQVNGWRGETETVEQIRKRVEHDLAYIDNWSLWMDLKIICRTVFTGFTGRNAF
jgi:Undecaprenyl-phosphate glucose phosphotransferase